MAPNHEDGDKGQGRRDTCSFPGCHRHSNKEGDGESGHETMKCGRCKSAQYCDRQCQKKHWKIHKITCIDAPRHAVESTTISALQEAIDRAGPGDVVVIPKGSYKGATELPILNINKPIRLVGAGIDTVHLHCKLIVKDGAGSAQKESKLVVADLTVDGAVSIGDTHFDGGITFLSVRVTCRSNFGSSQDAFEVKCRGKILLFCCEIYGGSDGLSIDGRETVMHIKDTEIEHAANRGIFANPYFTIEDSSVGYCGGYGIKGRSGWNEKGTNDIQPGPWSQYGGASGMCF